MVTLLWLNRYLHDDAAADDNHDEDDDGDGVMVMIAKKTSAKVTEFLKVSEVVAVGVHGISIFVTCSTCVDLM